MPSFSALLISPVILYIHMDDVLHSALSSVSDWLLLGYNFSLSSDGKSDLCHEYEVFLSRIL